MAGRRSLTLRLHPTIHAPSLARDAVRDCGAALPAETLRDAALLVSDLVANAVRYGEGMITVGLEYRSGSISVAVGDEGGRGLLILDLRPGLECGRGIAVIDRVSGPWSVRQPDHGSGTSV